MERYRHKNFPYLSCKAAAVVQVRAALASKVSRERVGTELEGMMNGECSLPPLPTALHGLGRLTAAIQSLLEALTALRTTFQRQQTLYHIPH